MPNSWWASIDWQLVVVIVFGLLTLLLMILLFLLGRRKKRLTYCVLSESPLARLTDTAPGNVQVLYDGKPVSNVYLVRIGFWNSGNLPIEARDYEQPVCIKVGAKSRILSAEITKTEPPLDHVFTVVDDGLTASLSTKLLNKGDRLTFEFLIADYSGDLTVDCRISGVDRLRDESDPPIFSRTLKALIGVIYGVGGGVIYLGLTRGQVIPISWFFLLASVAVGVGLGVLVAGLLVGVVERGWQRTLVMSGLQVPHSRLSRRRRTGRNTSAGPQ
jgi:hypothetical protein